MESLPTTVIQHTYIYIYIYMNIIVLIKSDLIRFYFS